MKSIILGSAVALIALGATQASAGGISPFDYGYNSSTTLLDQVSGGVSYSGSADLFGEFFDAGAGGTSVGDVSVTSFDLDDALSAAFDLTGIASINGATEVFFSEDLSGQTPVTNYISFFFENATNGFLFTVDVTGQGLDFRDEFAFIDTDAQISLVEYGVAPVPVPASLPLLLAGLGGLAVMRRRKAAAG